MKIVKNISISVFTIIYLYSIGAEPDSENVAHTANNKLKLYDDYYICY